MTQENIKIINLTFEYKDLEKLFDLLMNNFSKLDETNLKNLSYINAKLLK